MDNHVCTPPQLRDCGLLGSRYVIPVAGEGLEYLDVRVHYLRAGFKSPERALHGRDRDAAHHADDSRLTHARGDHARQVARLFQLEDERHHVFRVPPTSADDEGRIGELLAGAHGGVLVFEAVCKDQVVARRSIREEGFVEFGGGAGLLVADLSAERVPQEHESFICPRIPTGVANRTCREQRGANVHRGFALSVALLTGTRGHRQSGRN